MVTMLAGRRSGSARGEADEMGGVASLEDTEVLGCALRVERGAFSVRRIDEAVDAGIARLAAEPFEKELEVLGLWPDDRATEMVHREARHFAEALALAVDIEGTVGVGRDGATLAAGRH
jgi:hypothetical protein